MHQELLPPDNILEGDSATIRFAHDDTVLYPPAKMQMEVDRVPIEVKAVVSTALPVSVPLGKDAPELQQLIGSNAGNHSGSEDVMVVVTSTQAKKHLEDEMIKSEQELLSGAQASPVDWLEQSSGETGCTDISQEGQIPSAITQEQRCSLR